MNQHAHTIMTYKYQDVNVLNTMTEKIQISAAVTCKSHDQSHDHPLRAQVAHNDVQFDT